MIIIGFPNRIKAEKIDALIIKSEVIGPTNCEPKNTKNKTTKKSIIPFIFPLISKLYFEEAKAIPARSAPISIENPNMSNNTDTKRAQLIPNKNNTS